MKKKNQIPSLSVLKLTWIKNGTHVTIVTPLEILVLIMGWQNYSLQEVSTESRKWATNKQILEVAVGNKEPEAPFVHNQCYVK